MTPHDLDALLNTSLEDGRVSRRERRKLTAAIDAADLDGGQRAALRARLFDFARDRIGADEPRELLDWLETWTKILAVRDLAEDGPELAEVHFSPGDACRQRIVGLLKSATDRVDICVFTITDNVISDAILETHHRGIPVRIITDDDKSGDRGSDVDRLARNGVRVRVDRSPHHMHHKYALFDEDRLLTGSYNWTRSAAEKNEEHIVVSSDPRLIARFDDAFDALWKTLA